MAHRADELSVTCRERPSWPAAHDWSHVERLDAQRTPPHPHPPPPPPSPPMMRSGAPCAVVPKKLAGGSVASGSRPLSSRFLDVPASRGHAF